MNSKDYLNQYRDMMRLIGNLDAEITELSERLTSIKSTIGDGMPKAPSPESSLEKLHAILADKIREKKSMRFQAEWKRIEVEEVIDAVKDPVYHRLLQERYSNLKDWYEVTARMNYKSVPYVRGTLHKQALAAVQEILNR